MAAPIPLVPPVTMATLPSSRLIPALDDGHVGLAAALAHHLQPIAPRSAPGYAAAWSSAWRPSPDRVTKGDGAAADVDPGRVGAGLRHPGKDHGRERLVDLEKVDVVDREPVFASAWAVPGSAR